MYEYLALRRTGLRREAYYAVAISQPCVRLSECYLRLMIDGR